jgi:hypothetical protein
VVTFVDHQQRRRGDGVQAPRQRLHHDDLHEVGSHRVVRLDTPVCDAHGGQGGADLVGDFLAVGKDHNAVALGRCGRHDECKHNGLPATGRQHEQHPAASREGHPDRRHGLDLVGSQDWRGDSILHFSAPSRRAGTVRSGTAAELCYWGDVSA